MTVKGKVVTERNPHTGNWEVGWKYKEEDMFIPYLSGFATKKAAEAAIPGFDAQVEADTQAMFAKADADRAEEEEQFPNLRYVHAEIKKLSGDEAWDAVMKLSALRNMDITDRIEWPLPSWDEINDAHESGRVYWR